MAEMSRGIQTFHWQLASDREEDPNVKRDIKTTNPRSEITENTEIITAANLHHVSCCLQRGYIMQISLLLSFRGVF